MPTEDPALFDLCVANPQGGRLMDRAADLRSDYDRLGILLASAEGSAAAAIARERRTLSELLEGLERPSEVSLVDQLAIRRRTKSSDSRSASGRRKSG